MKQSCVLSLPVSFLFVAARIVFAQCGCLVFQSGKATSSDSSGVIDLTMDDEESAVSQGTEVVIIESDADFLS